MKVLNGHPVVVFTDAFNFVDAPMTAFMWFKRFDGAYARFAYANNDQAWGITMDSANVFAVGDSRDNGWGVGDAYATPEEEWTFAALRFDGENLTLNVNDRTKASTPATTLGDYSGGYLLVASEGGYCEFSKVTVSPRCWADSEIASLYQEGA